MNAPTTSAHSKAMPWKNYLAQAFVLVGGLFLLLSFSQATLDMEISMLRGGVVFVSLGVWYFANAHTDNVRANLLHRINSLETRVLDRRQG